MNTNSEHRDIEKMLHDALLEMNWLLPQTVEEVNTAEAQDACQAIPALPAHLADPMQILAVPRSALADILKFPGVDAPVAEGLRACAARNGTGISEEVLKKMEKNRARSEQDGEAPR